MSVNEIVPNLEWLYKERERCINLLGCLVSMGDILAKKGITKNDYESLVALYNKQYQLIVKDVSKGDKETMSYMIRSNDGVKIFAGLSLELIKQSKFLKSSQMAKSTHKSFISSINNEIEMLIDYAQKNEKDIKNTLKFEHKYDDENRRSEIVKLISASKKTYYKLALTKLDDMPEINEKERE